MEWSPSGGTELVHIKDKVLIVDDEPDVLESTALLVEALGYQAIRLSDPAEILETVEQEQPGILLQDLKMPGLNVAGLVAALRLNPLTAEVPLVFFSAGGDLPTTAARYDAWGYLAKPFGKEELARLLNQVLGAPAKRTGPWQGRDMQREVRSVFHDYWNLLAALSNYILILDRAKGLSAEAQKSVRGLDEIILKLESKTDRLSAYIMALVGSIEPVPVAQTATQARGGRSGGSEGGDTGRASGPGRSGGTGGSGSGRVSGPGKDDNTPTA